MKATVYRISGAVVSSNYIQLPKATSQSLGLTGRYLYLLFRPLPSKFFSVHLEVATTSGLAVRISLSNIFKEFKSTSTWLQFPYSVLRQETRGGVGERGREAGQSRTKKQGYYRWTLLVLDLREVLSQWLNTKFAYLKNIQLCANVLVRGVFTSHAEYSPLPDGGDSAQLEPLPRDMRFPLGKTEDFTELYDYVRFPAVTGGGDERLTRCVEVRGERERLQGGVRGDVGEGGRMGRRNRNSRRCDKPRVRRSSEEGGGRGEGVRSGVHVYVERGAEVNLLRGEEEAAGEGEEHSCSADQTDLGPASRPHSHAPPTLKVCVSIVK